MLVIRKWGTPMVAALLLAAWVAWAPASAAAQESTGWRFDDDAFADLWFHGLAVAGFYGFGPFPLYSPAYVSWARRDLGPSTPSPTPLERDRRELLTRFQGNDLFEVLHFVPMYFHGASREESMAALRAIAATSGSAPETTPATRFGVAVVVQLIPEDRERQVLGKFVEDLDREWGGVVAPRRAAHRDVWARRLRELQDAWDSQWAPPLAGFLEAEGFVSGTALIVPALGAEGRFLEQDPGGASGPLIALGMPQEGDGVAAVLSSLVRELCYPVVRRAFAPFEARLTDRVEASRASDLTATRCGELLLERRAPAQVPAYRARFDLPPGGSGRAFLSASGHVPGAEAWEGDLEDALLRELNLEPDVARLPAPPVRRR